MFHSTSTVSTDLLAEWRWLIGGLPRLLGWSSVGDLFMRYEDDSVWRLDTGAGTVDRSSDSEVAFSSLLIDPEAAEELLLLPVLREFEATHGTLGQEECLGFTTLPVFGGSYMSENRFRMRISEHASLTGELHRQIRDLPDGTRILLKVLP